MSGEDATVEISLARSLVERIDEGEVRRHWNKDAHQATGDFADKLAANEGLGLSWSQGTREVHNHERFRSAPPSAPITSAEEGELDDE